MIRLHSNVEARLNLTQVPRDALVEKRIGLICTVDRSLIAKRFPVLRLNLDILVEAGSTVALFPLEVLEHLTGLADVLKLIVAILSIDILFNRSCSNKKRSTKEVDWKKTIELIKSEDEV